MSRRVLWSCIAVVVAILAGSSLLSRQSADREAATAKLDHVVAWVREHPGIPLGVAGGLLIVWGFRRWRGGKATAAAGESQGPAEESSFADALDHALHHEGRGEPEGRRREVLALHRAGRSIGEIARATRLSQDAVRAVIEAG